MLKIKRRKNKVLRQKNGIAQDLRTPKYRMRILPDKRKKKEKYKYDYRDY